MTDLTNGFNSILTNKKKERRAVLESLEEPSIIITPSSISITPTPSLEEEEDDDFDDASEEFSFYKFSILNFLSNHSHTHLNQRLKQPLLPHDDEADVLVRGTSPTVTF